jgi:hypothetical protein
MFIYSPFHFETPATFLHISSWLFLRSRSASTFPCFPSRNRIRPSTPSRKNMAVTSGISSTFGPSPRCRNSCPSFRETVNVLPGSSSYVPNSPRMSEDLYPLWVDRHNNENPVHRRSATPLTVAARIAAYCWEICLIASYYCSFITSQIEKRGSPSRVCSSSFGFSPLPHKAARCLVRYRRGPPSALSLWSMGRGIQTNSVSSMSLVTCTTA